MVVGSVVKGRVGHFVILGFREIGGERYAQVKEVNPVTMKTARGEIALPVSILTPV